MRQLGADRRGQMVLDIADRHAAGLERDDHPVEPVVAAGGVAVPREGELEGADLGRHRLRAEAIAGVLEQGRLGIAAVEADLHGRQKRTASLGTPGDSLHVVAGFY